MLPAFRREAPATGISLLHSKQSHFTTARTKSNLFFLWHHAPNDAMRSPRIVEYSAITSAWRLSRLLSSNGRLWQVSDDRNGISFSSLVSARPSRRRRAAGAEEVRSCRPPFFLVDRWHGQLFFQRVAHQRPQLFAGICYSNLLANLGIVIGRRYGAGRLADYGITVTSRDNRPAQYLASLRHMLDDLDIGDVRLDVSRRDARRGRSL